MNIPQLEPGRWMDGILPSNAEFGENTIIAGRLAFKRFRSRRDSGFSVGVHRTLDGVHFPIGEETKVRIRARLPIMRQLVVIEDDVWIGLNETILKGVRLAVLRESDTSGYPARLDTEAR